jgi:hypothetical protein
MFAKYDTLTLDLSNGRISWPSDVVVAYLALRQPAAADVVLADAQPIDSNYYAPTPASGKAVRLAGNVATLRMAPVAIKTFGGNLSFQYVVFADASNANRLMFWLAFGSAPTFGPGTVTVGQAAADGLFDVCQLQ